MEDIFTATETKIQKKGFFEKMIPIPSLTYSPSSGAEAGGYTGAVTVSPEFGSPFIITGGGGGEGVLSGGSPSSKIVLYAIAGVAVLWLLTRKK